MNDTAAARLPAISSSETDLSTKMSQELTAKGIKDLEASVHAKIQEVRSVDTDSEFVWLTIDRQTRPTSNSGTWRSESGRQRWHWQLKLQ